MIPKKIHILTRDLEILDADTPFTRAWVSLNPHEDRTEYTDLSQVWHPAEEEPTKEQPILYFTKNGKIAVLNRVDVEKWDWYLDKYSILLWCYTEDVLPNKD